MFLPPGLDLSFNLNTHEKIIFPYKLFEVANIVDENNLSKYIDWNADGISISVNRVKFERNVMIDHPGLVEIPSFLNFRRQMREYSFDWKRVIDAENSFTDYFIFSHPYFKRGRKDLLQYVVTRRKRYLYKSNNSDNDIYSDISPLGKRVSRLPTRYSSMLSHKKISIKNNNVIIPKKRGRKRKNPLPDNEDIKKDDKGKNQIYDKFNLPIRSTLQYTEEWVQALHEDINKNEKEIMFGCMAWILQHETNDSEEYELQSLKNRVDDLINQVNPPPIYFYQDLLR